MLRVTYTGGDAPQKWLFDPDEVDVLEAERIEGALGGGASWDTFLMGLVSPSVRLRRVLLWHLLRRSNPGYDMPFSDTPNFKMGEFVVELGTKQIDGFINALRENPNITTQQRDRMIADFEVHRAEAALAEAAIDPEAVDFDPKEQQLEEPGTPSAVAPPTPPETEAAPAPTETNS